MPLTVEEREQFDRLRADWDATSAAPAVGGSTWGELREALYGGPEEMAEADREVDERRERLAKALGREPTLAEMINDLGTQYDAASA